MDDQAMQTHPLDRTKLELGKKSPRFTNDTLHARLKHATRAEHDIVDRSLSQFDLAHTDSYFAFLCLNREALALLRPHWRHADCPDFNSMAQSLKADLATMGRIPSTVATPQQGPINSMGLAYVVRGSRLGSKILRRRVGPGLPTAYLDFEPALPWPELLQELETLAGAGPEAEAAIIAGARATFAVYAQLSRIVGGLT